jgi:arsenite-transporting ATPase
MLPEALSLAETRDAIATLDAAELKVASLVINRVLPDGERCALCDRRRREERRVVADAARSIGATRVLRVVPEMDREVRGAGALAFLERQTKSGRRLGRRLAKAAAPSRPRVAGVRAPDPRPRLPIHTFDGASLVWFVGKGGTGKTTMAAATALALARSRSADRVLLLSVDPAHSLADVFNASPRDLRAGAEPIDPTVPNLRVRELDAAAELASRRCAIQAALDEIVAALGSGANRNVGSLLELAPPGIDELFGLVSVMEALQSDAYSQIVVDAAATGHALRLLEMPDAAREWVHVLLGLLLKYRRLVRPGKLAAELIDLSKSIRLLQQRFQSPNLTRFVAVTRAAEIPRLETERLLVRLKRAGVRVPVLLINAMTLLPGGCRRCNRTARAEAQEVAPLAEACRRSFRDCAIIQAPLVAPPPRGVAALERWARHWMS